MKQTALIEEHRKLGGRLIDFGGWELPVQYTGVMDEHLACRSAAGLFDVSHMGEVLVEGADAEKFLYHLVSNDVAKIEIGMAQYSALCRPDGGIVDDLIVYRRAKDRYLVVVNASNTDKDFAWMQKIHAEGGFQCRLENVSAKWSQIAIQGRQAETILQSLTPAKLSEVKTFRFVENTVLSIPAILARTGYTGEDGFEVYLPWAEAPRVWQALLEKGTPLGMKPCGLGARDTLRLEVKYPLYGNELTDTTNPLEAGLGFATKLDKTDFVGKAAIAAAKAKGLARKLVGFELKGAGIPRQGYKLFDPDGTTEIGFLTSGTQSPSLKKPIGIGYVAANRSEVGTKVLVEIRANKIPAEVVPTPFYKRPY
ncbi:MAG: glycine cleavage system aminomethyltransferase GcvT [Bdellovibrionales bacterium]|nr:glycine cleavage system aminomethyltransferase GcvT [Bdellovibrionales bacterium]